MEYRLGSINATLVGEELEYDNGQSEWLISYLAKYDWENQAPHSTEDAFKIGKVIKYFGYDWQAIENEAREIEANK